MRTEGLIELVTTTTPVSGWWVVVLTGVMALGVSASSFALLVAGSRGFLVHLNVLGTAFHEAGHAVMCVLTGGGVYQIEITSAESGCTHNLTSSRLSAIATTAAGYAAPPLAGVAAASLLGRGHAAAVLAITVVAMAMILFLTRDPITLAAVFAVGAPALATLVWGPGWLQTWVGYTEAWLLLTSEIAGLGHLVVARLYGSISPTDDAANLAEDTHIPGAVWIAGWATLIGWAVWHGVGLMWP